MLTTTHPHTSTSTDVADVAAAGLLVDLDLMDPTLAAELTAPRRLTEPAEDAAARAAALADITTDLITEAAEHLTFTPEEIETGGGDPWFDTDPDDDPLSWEDAA